MKIFKISIIIVFLFILFHFANYMYYRNLKECTIIYKIDPNETNKLNSIDDIRKEYIRDLEKCYSYNLLKLELNTLSKTCTGPRVCDILLNRAEEEGINLNMFTSMTREDMDTAIINELLDVISERDSHLYKKCEYSTFPSYFNKNIGNDNSIRDGKILLNIKDSIEDLSFIIEYIKNKEILERGKIEEYILQAYKTRLNYLKKLCNSNSYNPLCTRAILLREDGTTLTEIDSVVELQEYIDFHETSP